MNSLATVMGLYMTARMNPNDASLSNPSVSTGDINNLRAMYNAFVNCFRTEEKAILELVNFQLFIANNATDAEKLDLASLYDARADIQKSMTDSSKQNKKIHITGLVQFYKDIATLETDGGYLELIVKNNGSINWKDTFTTEGIKLTGDELTSYTGTKITFNGIIGNMVNVGTCTIGANNTPINSIGASNATSYLSGTQEARITNGIIYRFEERVGKVMDVRDLSISATVKRYGITVPASVKANVSTSIAQTAIPLFTQDYNSVDVSDAGLTFVANDTYGFAIDLWVRTNAAHSYLKLEGNVLTETKNVPETKIINGITYDIYKASVTITGQNEEGKEESITKDYFVYQKDGKWYNAESFVEITAEFDSEPIPNMVEVETVIGYEGDNRIWDETAGLSVNSTTQGSGSCYVYYADTPEDQARSLKLLQSMKIAFIDGEGKLLTIAEMDTEHFYAANGKVTVPIVLPQTAISLGTDINGKEQYAIMPLQQNVATRITAIVYLDGENLTNADVLAAADIQGQLNIQFGSSATLNNMDDETLKNQTMNISASVDKDSFKYDEATEANPMTTNVTVTIDGEKPGKVTAFFLRAINSTQGAREQVMNFTYNEATGKWEASYTFNSPGNYILRSVTIDGISYDLTDPPKVTIEGFTITSVNWTPGVRTASFMTADSYVTTDLTVSFASHDVNKMPKTVEGRFIREEDGSVNSVKFKYDSNAGLWKGTVTFNVSGNYSLMYLRLDGKDEAIPDGTGGNTDMCKYAKVYLGMKVEVTTDSPWEFKYELDEIANAPEKQDLKMRVKIMDDTGNQLPGLTGVNLYYRSQGSPLIENGMHAELEWNGEEYVGSFRSKIGIYEFLKVTVDVMDGDTVVTNTITNATSYPTFKIKSVTPPSLYTEANQSVAWQYVPTITESEYARFIIRLDKEAAALTDVTAVVIKKDDAGNEIERFNIESSDIKINTSDPYGQYYDWEIKIPVDATANNQEGIWQLLEMSIPSVGEYTADNPLVFTFPDDKGKVTEDVVVTVVSQVQVSVQTSGTIKFEDAQFLEAKTIESGTFSVIVTDSSGNKINSDKIDTTVKLHYTYNYKDAKSYGGYTVTNSQYLAGGFDIDLNRQSDGKTFKQESDISVPYAGTYTLSKITYKIAGVDYEMENGGENPLPSGLPTIELHSIKPSVKIIGVDPGTGTSINTENSGSKKNSFSDYSAEVYFKYELEEHICGDPTKVFTQSKVTIQILNIGNAQSASMTFVSSNAGEFKFDWTPSKTDYTCGIGAIASGQESRTAAGSMECNTLVLVNGNNTFTIVLDNPITINNPD